VCANIFGYILLVGLQKSIYERWLFVCLLVEISQTMTPFGTIGKHSMSKGAPSW